MSEEPSYLDPLWRFATSGVRIPGKVGVMIHTEREYRASLAYRDALRKDRQRAVAVSGLDPLAREWIVGDIDRALAAVETELAEYEELAAETRKPLV